MTRPRGLATYGLITRAITPLVPAYLRRRAKRGKEDPSRLNERIGHPRMARPAGHLVWVHAASVGEALSVQAFIDALRAQRPGISVLFTTGTVTAARLLAHRLPPGAIHQFVPVDTPAAIEGFLDHWQPDYMVLVESELWPNLITRTRARGIRMALINARMSAASMRGWRWGGATARQITGSFDIVLAQDTAAAARFRQLGAHNVHAVGNLKADVPPPPAPPALLGEVTGIVAGRPAWLAASTHAGEERTIAQAHALLKQAIPGLLTIIVPRHPERGAQISQLLTDMQLTHARRSTGERVTARTDIYLADTLGELGGFFRILTIVFMGGALVRAGGHNPIEPALLGAALLTGPHTHNFTEFYAAFEHNQACETVHDAASLAAAVGRLMADGALAGQRVSAAAETAGQLTGALQKTLDQLLPLLDAAMPHAGTAATMRHASS